MANEWWDFISAAMERKGMTGAQLADAAGYDRSNITNWKKGASNPRPEQVRSTARVLDVNYVEALIASGVLTDEEINIERVRPDLSLVPDDEILAEAARRLLVAAQRSKESKGKRK